MPKKLIKRYFPDPHLIRSHRHIKLFGNLLTDQNLWHLNRKSVSGALAVGLFVAFVPLPGQMLIAAAAAIVFRVNLPISVATVWITNPVTIPIFFYFAYEVGAWIMGVTPQTGQSGFSISRMLDTLGHSWKPFLLGCFIVGSLSALAGFITARLYWRWWVLTKWAKRDKGPRP